MVRGAIPTRMLIRPTSELASSLTGQVPTLTSFTENQYMHFFMCCECATHGDGQTEDRLQEPVPSSTLEVLRFELGSPGSMASPSPLTTSPAQLWPFIIDLRSIIAVLPTRADSISWELLYSSQSTRWPMPLWWPAQGSGRRVYSFWQAYSVCSNNDTSVQRCLLPQGVTAALTC